MATLSHSPTYPAPNYPVAVSFALTQSGSDFVRVWCTTAPTGSRLDQLINSSRDPRSRVEVFEGTPAQAWNTTFDKGGKYTFVSQEYSKGDGYGGGYEGDPRSASTEVKKGSESTLTLHIGQRVTQPIGPPGNQATLVLWVWDNKIRSTTKAFQGEDSPAITAPSPTPRVKTALESAAVKQTLVDLDGGTLTSFTVAGHPEDWVASVYSAFNGHIDYASAHANDDTFNAFLPTYEITQDDKAVIEFVNQGIRLLTRHVTNDCGTAPDPLLGPAQSGPDSASFHQVSGVNVSDRAAIPLYASVGTFAEAFGGLVDLIRCLNVHQYNADIHDFPIVIGIRDMSRLQLVHHAFLEVLAAQLPDVPPAQSTGVHRLITNAGFKES